MTANRVRVDIYQSTCGSNRPKAAGAAFEGQLASYGPTWLAYDMRLMMAGIQRFGMQSTEGTVENLQTLIGHPLRTYEDSVREAVAEV